MNPLSGFRTLRGIAGRRPLLVAVVGLGLLGEAGRVGAALARGGAVTLFGHSGGEVWDASADAPWVAAYAVWVAACGATVVGLAIAGWRAKRRAAVDPPQADAVRGATTSKPSRITAGSGVVVRRREIVEKRPTRLSR